MDRRQLDIALPMIFGITVAVVAVLGNGTALTLVAIMGGGLIGLYFAAIRPGLMRDRGEGPPGQD